MLIPVGALTVLTAVGGALGIAGVWEPLEEWVAETSEPLVEVTTSQDYGTSLVAVLIGLAGVFVAWRVVRERRELVSQPVLLSTLEHKLWFDELYDMVVSRPVQSFAGLLRDRVEGPLVHRSLDEVARGSLEAGGSMARAQTGLLRTYALVIAASVVVLAVVFLVVR